MQIMKSRSTFSPRSIALAIGLSALIGACTASAPQKQTLQAGGPATITIASAVPTELNPSGGGAPAASMAQAANFAWQEFIALNWPARLQTGQKGDRDAPAADCRFADPACASRPLTWQTFRGKAEIFTNGALQPYDTLPTYQDVYAGPIGPCAGQTPPQQAAWVNLDETSQITLDAMYAGIGPTSASGNSQPQLIRFMAKANRAENDYYQALVGKYNTPNPAQQLQAATVDYFEHKGDPAPGSLQYVSLPNNVIEIKAGWRMLNPTKEDVRRFHTTTIRYYEGNFPSQCYREAVWGLVALHIIQKTASAPYFIYATFEQADNLRTADGRPVEDQDGNIIAQPACRADQQAPCPTTPSVAFTDGPNPPKKPTDPPIVTLSPASAAYCTASTGTPPANRLYYLNNSQLPALPSQGYVCVNSRDNAIPAEIIQANKAAHAAMAAYARAQGIGPGPWGYYKLINVQYVPIDKVAPGLYPGRDPTTGKNPASYYLANGVVETNRPLQMFSGGLVSGGSLGVNSDYPTQFGEPAGGTHKNSFYQAHGYDMGGCMGCHGSQGQHQGGDFSVILARGQADQPEGLPAVTRGGATMRAPPSRRLHFGF
jgi:hypothetical protein